MAVPPKIIACVKGYSELDDAIIRIILYKYHNTTDLVNIYHKTEVKTEYELRDIYTFLKHNNIHPQKIKRTIFLIELDFESDVSDSDELTRLMRDIYSCANSRVALILSLYSYSSISEDQKYFIRHVYDYRRDHNLEHTI